MPREEHRYDALNGAEDLQNTATRDLGHLVRW